jgi:hypothetical protein
MVTVLVYCTMLYLEKFRGGEVNCWHGLLIMKRGERPTPLNEALLHCSKDTLSGY